MISSTEYMVGEEYPGEGLRGNCNCAGQGRDSARHGRRRAEIGPRNVLKIESVKIS